MEAKNKLIVDFADVLFSMSNMDNQSLRDRKKIAKFYVEKSKDIIKNFDKGDPNLSVIDDLIIDTLDNINILLRFVKDE